MAGKVIELQQKLALPDGYRLSDAEVLKIEAAFASFDGSGAASAFEPCLTFKAPDGAVLSRVRPSSTIAAGASADVSYAPFPGGIDSGGGSPGPPSTQLDYAEPAPGTLAITAVTAATADLFIQGNPFYVDGATRIRIEVWIALASTTHDVVCEVYEDGTDLCRAAQLGVAPGQLTNGQVMHIDASLYGTFFRTPAAGMHSYQIRGFTDAPPATFLNPAPLPFSIFAPSFYRVIVA